MAESSAASLDGEVHMRGRSVRAVNEVAFKAVGKAAVRDGRVGRQCGELLYLHYPNCTSVGLVMISLSFAVPTWCMEGEGREKEKETEEGTPEGHEVAY